MTSRDKWKGRPVVLKYRAYKDELRLRRLEIPAGLAHLVFVFPVPKTWSAKRRAAAIGEKHENKPDIDNVHKGLLDAVFKEDAMVWDARITKVWGHIGAIVVTDLDKFRDQAELKQFVINLR